MPRSPRADEAGGLYHALNRANLGAKIFRTEGDFIAFEKVLHEALQLYKVELYAYQIMGTHWHLVLRPQVDGEMGRFCKWVDRVNEPLTGSELKSVRNCAQRGAPLGDAGWTESIARRLDLESTMRPRGRPRVRPLPPDDPNKEV